MSDGTTSLPTGIFHLPGYWYTDDISLCAARCEHVRYIGVTNRVLADCEFSHNFSLYNVFRIIVEIIYSVNHIYTLLRLAIIYIYIYIGAV